jgi:hypothetical protein
MLFAAMIKKSPSKLRDSLSNPHGLNDIAPAVAPSDLTSDERWLLAQRVAQSERFRNSPRLRAFLLFVVERTLRNCSAELSEYEIGTRVFDRTADFNPADDSIVRSSARLLRGKLKEHFAGEGRHEPLVIEVPKGGYVPDFVPRPPDGATALEVVPVRRADRAPLGIYALSAACLVLLAACAFLWKSRALPATLQPGSGSPPNLIFAIFQPGVELNLVYGDSSMVGGGPAIPDNAGSRLITSYRDAAFELRLAESASRLGRTLIGHHSRLMQARDFRAGNFILLGGVLANPWSKLFESGLNFRFAADPSDPHRHGFQNLAPHAGEAPFYWFSQEEGRNATRYARIALTPNLTGTGKILTLAGQSAEGTEGAGDAALARDFPARVQALLGNRPLHEIADLELLLEVHSMDGAARETRILAYRVR